MKLGRLAAFRRLPATSAFNFCRPPLARMTGMAAQATAHPKDYAPVGAPQQQVPRSTSEAAAGVQQLGRRKFSAYASHLAAGHDTQADVQLDISLNFHECVTNRSAVLELDFQELPQAVELFLQRRALAGFSHGEEAVKVLADQLADRASVLYFEELDFGRLQACPKLSVLFRRLEEKGVLVLAETCRAQQRRTISDLLEG